MPTYQYKCKACGKDLEIFQKITAEPIIDCPNCKKPELKRLIGGGQATLQFKGNGFYITDYAKKEQPSNCNDACQCNQKCRD